MVYTDFLFPLSDSDGVYEGVYEEKSAFLLSLKNGTATLIKTGDSFDTEELVAFLRFWSVNDIISDFKTDFINKEYHLYSCVPKEQLNQATELLTPFSRFFEYKKIYEILNPDGKNFDYWFSSFSRKINSSKNICCYYNEAEAVNSVCVVSGIYNGKAVISGVATHSENQKKGYASKCIKSVLNELYNKNISDVYLWCEHKNTAFYEKLGFNKIGEIYYKTEE